MAETLLREQVCIVTGASRGIGRAIALRLASLGATTIVAARDQEALATVASEISAAGGNAETAPCDLRSPEAITGLVNGIVERHGRIDILVNNAGIGTFGVPLHQTSLATWDATMETNLRAVYLMMRAVAPHMMARQSGQIINISSLAAHNPVANAACYAASKWALHGLSISAAEELRAHGIRVSLVAPGSVATDISPELTRGKERARMLQPDDIAHAVAMLATQSAGSFVSEVWSRPGDKRRLTPPRLSGCDAHVQLHAPLRTLGRVDAMHHFSPGSSIVCRQRMPALLRASPSCRELIRPTRKP